jgi:predicted acyl esterase
MLQINKSVACIFVFGLLLVLVQAASGAERISRLGKYVGYSTEQHDGWQRSSQYVTVRDGTRIAIDYFRPTLANELHSEKLPVLFTTTRYQRAGLIDGRLLTVIDQMPYLVRAIKHGYVIAIADVRGSGASFGKKLGFFPPEEARDSYDVIEWLARQDWSSGKVGMFSQSYLGTTQMFAASASPPSLKAIFPEVAWLDTYASFYPGGIFKLWPVYNWSTFVRTADFVAPLPPDWRAMMKAADETKTVSEAPLDCELSFCTNPGGTSATPVVPVDEDVDGRLLAEATAEHRQGDWSTFQLVRAVPYRDSKVAGMDIPLSEERSVYSVLEEIKSSGIPAYHYGGWFDGFSRDTPLLYRSWPNSKKLIMGPWYHGGFRKEILETEYLRWFDYWLKGIDNGVMDEDAVHYYVMGAADGDAWRSSKTWPLPN